jgi:hypothetical protein
MQVIIEAFGTKKMSRRIERLAQRARDPRPAFQEVYDRFRELSSIHFARQGAGPSGPWAPLSPATVQRKARMRAIGLKADPRILHETLVLRSSLTKKKAKFAVFRVTKDEVVMGSRDPKGKFHSNRPPIDLYEGDKREMVRTVQEFILG